MVAVAQGHERFHSLQVGDKDKLKWVRTEVDINRHVIIPQIDSTKISSAENFLEDYLYNLTKTGIDMSKPMWDFHVLNGVETSGNVKSVVIGRFHHSLGDGKSLMLYFLNDATRALDGSPLTASSLFPGTNKNISAGGRKARKKSINDKIKSTWDVAYNTTIDVLALLGTMTGMWNDTKNPFSGLPDTAQACRRIVQLTVSLDDIRLVKAATNTTVNDVLMALLEAGVSRYLNRKYSEMSCKGQKRYKSGNIRLRTLVAFDLRMNSHSPSSQIGSISGESGNQVGYILYPLRVPLRSNPLDYVRTAKAKMDGKKASLGPRFANAFTSVMIKLFGTKVLSVPKTVSMYYSNMIGPLDYISAYGHPLDHMAVSIYGISVGLNVNVTSYANKLTFALSVDERVIPDPHQLLDDIENSLNLIKNAALDN